jgi:hypothetical protein
MENPLLLRLTALLIMATGIILFLPLPLMNTLPALLILLIGVGLLNHDGLLLLAGTVGCLGVLLFLLFNAHFFLSRLGG